MNYELFSESLDKNSIHPLDGSAQTSDISLDGLEISEPHYLVSSSGSVNEKTYLISLNALKTSAQIVVDHYNLSLSDRWLQSLSTKHIGGFMINLRSWVSDMKAPFQAPFDLSTLSETVSKEKITILSLVPTQIFDLVSHNIKAPKGLEHVFVGGAVLNQELYKRALDLGWPLRLCFGMTETSAQFSYSEDGLSYKPYSGWKVRTGIESSLEVSGPGLFSYFLKEGKFIKREDDFFVSDDLVNCAHDSFVFKGRAVESLKRKASFVDFEKIKKEIYEQALDLKIKRESFEIIAAEDKRAGVNFYLIMEQAGGLSKLQHNNLRGVFYLKKIPRSSIGKIKLKNLEELLSVQLLSY